MSFIGKNTNYLDFGAVKINPFPKAVPCTTNNTFCQPTNQTDDIEFQFEVSESEDLTTAGVIGDSTGWALFAIIGGASGFQSTAVVNNLTDKGILTINDFYKVTLTVADYPGGVLRVGGGTGAAIFNQAISIRSNGTFTAFFQYNEPAGDGDFIITADLEGQVGIQVSGLSVTKISDISDYTVQIIDTEDSSVVDTVPTANLRLFENMMTVQFNWLNDLTVTNGCRAIRILNGTDIFQDNFTTDQGWVLGGDVTITGGVMNYDNGGLACPPAPPSFLCGATIDGIFTPGESYTITYTVSNIGTITLAVFCGDTPGTIRSTNGTFVETLICTNTSVLGFFFNGAALNSVDIDNVTIKKENNIDGQSECYDLQTTHDCTLLFEWSNNESWGGFNYTTPSVGDAFVQRLRIESKFRGAKYPSQRNIGETSAGVKTMDYTSFRKARILDIHRAPDYIHDAIASMFMQDTRTVEDTSYVLVDEYEPSAPNDSRVLWKDFMTARLELEQTDQTKQINRNA